MTPELIERHGPAMKHRATDKGYPFGTRVPKRVRTNRAVKSDTFCGVEIANPPLRAERGGVFDAWTNSYGAVSAITESGTLGLYPSEFEVVEWFDFAARAKGGAA